jgi:hypothetical protein
MKMISAIRRIALTALAGMFVLALALPARAREFAVSVLVDPVTGARWVLLRDTAHPDKPGRWVLRRGAEVDAAASQPEPPVIHSGDRVLLIEHTAIADARLTAYALTSAAKGEALRVRVAIGGGIVTARADGKGIAELGSVEISPAKPVSVESSSSESHPFESGSETAALGAQP